MRKSLVFLLVLWVPLAGALLLGIGAATLVNPARVACVIKATSSSPAGGGVRIGTLNWRGASHYRHDPHRGEQPYRKRVPNMVTKIDASGVSIVGFQEFESPQAHAFLAETDGRWAIVRGRAAGSPDTRDAIAYQTDRWRVDQVRYITINYGGSSVQIPFAHFVEATDGAAGGSGLWVLNTHNPADVVNGSAAMRDAAVAAEAGSLTRMHTEQPSAQLFLTGDMNDHARFKDRFLQLAGAGWSTANPGDGQIDWIMGGPGVSFADAVVDQSTNDGARAFTDHPFVHAGLAEEPPAEQAQTEQRPVPQVAPGPAVVAAAAAYQAGFRGADLVTAVAIAGVESSWNPRATDGAHYGLWQIADPHQTLVPGWSTAADILNPALNARFAFALYSSRPRKTTAKFADWLPFETTDYHRYLFAARAAVQTATGESGSESDPCVSAETVAAHLSAELGARIAAMRNTPYGLCALSWTSGAPCTYDNQCPKVVDALFGGSGTGRGYGNGQDVAQGIIDAGLAQARGTGLNPLPPDGAVVSYNTGNGTGHVAIYVGHGKIFGNDYGCRANGSYGCVGFADVHAPGGLVTWALPAPAFDLHGVPSSHVRSPNARG